MQITGEIDHYTIRIYVDNVLHLYIWKEQLLGFQSWIDTKRRHVIEYYLKDGKILSEYDDRETWVQVLKILEENL